MSDLITLIGLVATSPNAITTAEGLAITSFRLASNQRKFDRAQDKWVDGDTNWYTVTAFRQLATNAAVSVKKGDRVVVTGRLRIRDWENGAKRGTNVDVEADALGHDLAWGTAAFSRSVGSTPVDAAAVDVVAAASATAAASVSADTAGTSGTAVAPESAGDSAALATLVPAVTDLEAPF
ncbi:MAG: single-stranded DNA-binding protein [Galbitalea sp.]